MNPYRGRVRGAAALGFRALVTVLVLTYFWRALVSFAAVLAVVLAALATATATTVAVARWVLIRRRGW